MLMFLTAHSRKTQIAVEQCYRFRDEHLRAKFSGLMRGLSRNLDKHAKRLLKIYSYPAGIILKQMSYNSFTGG